MKTVPLLAWGQPVQIEELLKPIPGSDEVLVRVRAASVNLLDKAIAAGYLAGGENSAYAQANERGGRIGIGNYRILKAIIDGIIAVILLGQLA